MKFFILIMLFATNVIAINNPRVAIKTNDTFVMHKANNKNITEIDTKNTALSGVVDAYKVCIDKGLIYLGAGATDVDADNCYDVANTTNPETRFRPTFIDFLPYDPHFLGSGNFPALQGRFGADKACNTEFPGSRAMVYDDLRYVLPALNTPANLAKGSSVWVFDTVKSYYNASSNLVLTKDGKNAESNLYDCDGWKASSSSIKGTILQKITSGSFTFFQVSSQQCNQTAKIACIGN